MSITQTTAGWSFVHQGRRYTYPTRELAREALYDRQHDRAPAADRVVQAEALAKVDPEDRPFCIAITEWLDRVPDSHRGYATAGLTLIEIACDADEDLGALDEEQQAALGAYTEGWKAGRADLMLRIRAELEDGKAAREAAYTAGANDAARAILEDAEQQLAEAEARRAA